MNTSLLMKGIEWEMIHAQAFVKTTPAPYCYCCFVYV